MAEHKKSFIAYSDWNGMFKALPDEVAGRLIKHIFSYVNDENPSTDDYIINALFEQIKSTLKRDLNKYDVIVPSNKALSIIDKILDKKHKTIKDISFSLAYFGENRKDDKSSLIICDKNDKDALPCLFRGKKIEYVNKYKDNKKIILLNSLM
jgi:hypothetical protein